MPSVFTLPGRNAPTMLDSGQQSLVNHVQDWSNNRDQRLNALSQRLSGTPAPIGGQMGNNNMGTRLGPTYQMRNQAALNFNRGKAGLDPLYTPGVPGSPGTPGGPNTGQISTGISAGQMPQAIVQAAMRRLGTDAAPGVPITPAQNAEMQMQFQDMTRQQGAGAATDLDRLASFEGGRLQLAGERARAGAGLDWMNLLARLNEADLQRESQREQMAFGLMGI